MDSTKKKVGRPRTKEPSDKVLARRKQRQAQKDGTNKPRGRPKSTQKQTQSQTVNVKITQDKSKSKRRAKSRPISQMPPASIPQPTIIQQPAPAQPDFMPVIQAILQSRTPLHQKVNESTAIAQQMAGVKAEERRAGKTAGSFRSMSNDFFGSDQDLTGFEAEPTPSIVSSIPTGFFDEASELIISPDSSILNVSPISSEADFVTPTKGTGTFGPRITQQQMFAQQELQSPVELFRELGMISPRPVRSPLLRTTTR